MAAITKHQDPAIVSFDPSFAPAGNGSEHSEVQILVQEHQTATVNLQKSLNQCWGR